jgi:FSR family fosmidomycin resistance protein-like MFS transporter
VSSNILKNRALVIFMSGHFSNDLLVGVLPVLFPIFKREFGLDNAQLGLVTLGYSIASSLTQPLFGYISDKVRRYWFPPVIVLWGGVFVGLYGFATGFWSLFLLAILAGLGSAAFHPLGATNAAGVVHEHHRNTSMSLYTVAGTGGFALGPIVAVGFTSLFGIRGTICFTILAAIAAVFMYFELRKLNAMGMLNQGRAIQTQSDSAPPVDYRMLAKVILAIMMRSWSFMAILQFTPLWYDDLGHSEAFYGALVTVVTLISALGTLAGGWFADRVGGRLVVVGSLVLTIPAMLVYIHFPGYSAFGTGSTYGFLSDSSTAIALLAAQRLMPGRTGVASSMILGLGFVSGGLGVPIVGRIIDSVGYTSGLTMLVFVNLAAVLIAASIPASVWGVKRQPAEAEPAATPA